MAGHQWRSGWTQGHTTRSTKKGGRDVIVDISWAVGTFFSFPCSLVFLVHFFFLDIFLYQGNPPPHHTTTKKGPRDSRHGEASEALATFDLNLYQGLFKK